MPPRSPREFLDGREHSAFPPVMNCRNTDAQARCEGACGIPSICTGCRVGGRLPIGPWFVDLIVMANPGNGLRGKRSASTTDKPLGIQGLRNSGISPAYR